VVEGAILRFEANGARAWGEGKAAFAKHRTFAQRSQWRGRLSDEGNENSNPFGWLSSRMNRRFYASKPMEREGARACRGFALRSQWADDLRARKMFFAGRRNCATKPACVKIQPHLALEGQRTRGERCYGTTGFWPSYAPDYRSTVRNGIGPRELRCHKYLRGREIEEMTLFSRFVMDLIVTRIRTLCALKQPLAQASVPT